MLNKYTTSELIAELRKRVTPEEYNLNQNDFEKLAYEIDHEGKSAFYDLNPNEAA